MHDHGLQGIEWVMGQANAVDTTSIDGSFFLVAKVVMIRHREIMPLCTRIILRTIDDLAHNWSNPA